MLNTWDEDVCCGPRLARALAKGALESTDLWECPKCGCEWQAHIVGELRHWRPVILVAIV